jgi:hypothetical protein
MLENWKDGILECWLFQVLGFRLQIFIVLTCLNLKSKINGTPILQHSNTPCVLGCGLPAALGEHDSAKQQRV